MRVGVFTVMAGRQAGGPETYERALMGAIARLDHHNQYRIYCLDRGAPALFDTVASNMSCQVLWPELRVFSTMVSLPWALVTQGMDLLHATFTPPPISPRMRCTSSACPKWRGSSAGWTECASAWALPGACANSSTRSAPTRAIIRKPKRNGLSCSKKHSALQVAKLLTSF